jgi:hypothetical protein
MIVSEGMEDDLERLHAALSRSGLLLEHDQRLPSATTLLAGAPLQGSWWGPPHGKRIYAVLEAFAAGEGALCVKLVNAKRTYVHRSLWPAFLTLVNARAAGSCRELSPLAGRLHAHVVGVGRVRADELVTAGFAQSRALAKAGAELDLRLLVHVDSVHTSAGVHTKVYCSWPVWAERHGVEPSDETPGECRKQLAGAVARLQAGARADQKLEVPLIA